MATTRLISSQAYRNDKIVRAKRAARDYVVTVVTLDCGFQVVVDGHHRLVAAALDGVAPEIVECRCQDTLAGLDDLEAWLTRHWIDSEYRYVSESGYSDGQPVW